MINTFFFFLSFQIQETFFDQKKKKFRKDKTPHEHLKAFPLRTPWIFIFYFFLLVEEENGFGKEKKKEMTNTH